MKTLNRLKWSWDNVSSAEHVELGERIMDELSLLRIAAKQMSCSEREMEEDDVKDFLDGLESIAQRAAEEVGGLVNRLREIIEHCPEVAKYETGE